ncbi:MAG: hypothetical protein MRY64_05795 [Hyphomonadaceae bacterium]|nr:hypothetical protein [Hyphomonadaceae bacterium]
MRLHAALFGMALLAMAPAATADLGASVTSPPDISGNWNFRSYTYDECDFTGTARLRPTEKAGTYSCELTARQACPEIEWVVRQSCIANRTEDRLIIRSTIEQFINGPETSDYWPDNFILKIRSDDLMTGTLVSHGSYASEFTRQAEGIS